ncbi:polyprenyl synthetase family protein [Natroniella sp. ANB-PHB2]|uniref:polyprenyl synthetase family protein n=1 Tax=Natroniella sp. ANB-PHB2 TaxID=3384444 RepID=UPI0038D3EB89
MSGQKESVLSEITITMFKLVQEILEEEEKRDYFDLTEDAYLKKIELKTAALSACSCKVGGILSGVTEEGIVHLENYGKYLGIIYQINNDILAFTNNTDKMDYSVENNQQQDTLTLPLIHSLNQKIDMEVSDITLGPRAITEIIQELNYCTVNDSSLEYAYSMMEHFALLAKEELDYFSKSSTTKSLNYIIDFLLNNIELNS